jgi:Mycotoxin biosynthesis protein UstYa
VTLPKSIASEKGLWPTPEDPYNSENSIYLLSGFHHIHCLVWMLLQVRHYEMHLICLQTVVRDHIWHGKTHTKHEWSWPHINHCLDTIRQTLMCNIDTTLLGTTHADLRVFGDGHQPHTCKDFWGIKQWLTEHSPTGKIGGD